MRINETGIEIIKKWEGLCDGDPSTVLLDPYLDPIGIPTIGYGSIWDMDGRRVTMDTPPVTQDEADFLMYRELSHVEDDLERSVSVPLNDNQFSALSSFIYNVGIGNFRTSTLRMKLNRGDYAGAANEFWKWRRAGGKILRGLVARRKDEENLFVTPSERMVL